MRATAEFLARNPEIRVLQRHAGAAAQTVASSTAQLFRRYDAEMTRLAAAEFLILTRNPEVRVLQRHADAAAQTVANSTAQLFRRYDAEMIRLAGPSSWPATPRSGFCSATPMRRPKRSPAPRPNSSAATTPR